MNTKILSTLATLLASTALAAEAPQKPVALDWKAIKIAALDYDRTAIEGGAGLYTLPGKAEKKFRIVLLFSTGLYHFPMTDLAPAEAAAELLIKGGVGNRSFEELENYASENGIEISASYNSHGKLEVQAEALSEDFEKTVALLEDVLLRPRFAADGFALWKQERNDTFRSLLDAGNQRKQGRFMSFAINRVVFGENHPLTQTLARQSPRATESLKLPRIQEIAKTMVARAGLNAVLAGGFSTKNKESLQRLLVKIPRGEIRPDVWLPARPAGVFGKTRVVILRKDDMKTARFEVRTYVLGAGKLNKLEKAEAWVAEDVFSSSAGVVGNDRWSKAMRGDTGFGYAPFAYFSETTLKPQSGVGIWLLGFQSPNDRVHDAYRVYKKTWDEYAQKGVTPDEVEAARVSRINTRLAEEETLFDKAAGFVGDLAEGMLPSPIPTELTLARLQETRDPAAINTTLGRITTSDTVSAMVIMGNPTPAAIAELKKFPEVEVVETLDLAKVVAGFTN